MEEGEYDESCELTKADYQYFIRHTKTNCFSLGETVFLTCNPESPMIVHSFNENDIICTWKAKDGELQVASFSPGSILQYKYRCLIVWRDKFNICLN